MNKNQYRIVFNARRGMRMAVAETAASQGKSASGESCSASTGPGAADADRTVFALAAGACLILLSGLLAPTVDAQIVADRNAPGNQQPTILQTANGLPQINIQTPSAAGVSRNTYTQFDVSSKGVILNNSRTDVNTQLGGYVQGNPCLTAGSARVILNEVNSSSASQLRGYVEVAGQRAEVIIANPAGIAVNGGGFLNASAVTLTTGTAVMNAGSLDSFRVRGGNVTVDGTGLDTSTADYTNILARAVQVNAGIWAKDLKVVTGANDISAASAATPIVTASSTGVGAIPAFALDVAALGGMYAGKIFLIGTEAGLGVRNGGVIGATAGDVVLTHNGWLSNAGTVYAAGNTAITAQGDVSQSDKGLIGAAGSTRVQAQGMGSRITGTSQTTVAAGMDPTGQIGKSGTLVLDAAGAMQYAGQASAGSSVNMTARGGNLDGTGSRIAAATVALSSPGMVRTDMASVTAQQLQLTAHDLSNVAGTLQQSGAGDTAINLAGSLDNTGGTIATNAKNLNLSATALTNSSGRIQHAGSGRLGVQTQTLDNSRGSITTNGDLALQNVQGIINTQGGIATRGNANIATGNLSNTAGSVYAAGAQTLTANTGGVTNTGIIASLGDLQVNAQSLSSSSTGLLAAGMDATGRFGSTGAQLAITTTGSTAPHGQTLASGVLSVQASSIDLSSTAGESQSALTQGSNVSLTATLGDITTASASVLATQALTITANSTGSQMLSNISGGTLRAANTTIKANTVDNTQGLVIGGTSLEVDANTIINHQTNVRDVQGNPLNLGLAGGQLTLNAQTLDNAGGALRAGGDLTANVLTKLDNSLGLIATTDGGNLRIQSSAVPVSAASLNIVNTGGVLLSSADTSVQHLGTLNLAANSVTGDGQILSQGDLSLTLASDFTNSGKVAANGNASITSVGNIHNSGTLQAGNTLTASAANVDNTARGQIQGGNTKLNVSDTLDNRGLIDASNAQGTGLTLIHAATVNNTGTGRIYGDNIAIKAQTLANQSETLSTPAPGTSAATIASRNDLNLGVTTLNNTGGASILSLGNMNIGGALDADNKASGRAGVVTNSASSIEAMGALQIQATSIKNLNPNLTWEVVDTATTYIEDYQVGGATYSTTNGASLQYPGRNYLPNHFINGVFQFMGPDARGLVLPTADATSALEVSSLRTYTQTDRGAHVTASTPGTIRSGADLLLNATDSIVNDQSSILAGGALHVTAAAVDNRSLSATVGVLQQGTAYSWQHHDFGCGDKGCTYDYNAYTPNTFSRTLQKTIEINTSVALQNQSLERLNAPSASATTQVGQAIRIAGAAGPSTGPSNSATPVGIRTVVPNVNLPTSGLFKLNTSAPTPGQPSAPLIETDPRFTNRQAWLSSDYIIQQVSLDPSVTQKRLGDGFYEQKLLREQVAQLTGRRFLGDYTSDQQEYQALMDSGLTFARAFHLREGVALTAAQMALLTTDIVWLEQQTIKLPDGTVTQALVPHVYAAAREGDLAPSGALLSGNSVDIRTSGDLTNSGSILGRRVVQINANTINNNLGQIDGNDVVLSARQDINNIGGSIGAQNSLTALAGRDINVTSTTQSSAGSSGAYSYSQSGVDRLATLYVRGPGTLLASAGNNINLTAAQLTGGGDVNLQAGNSVNLATVQKSQSNNFGAGDANNHTLSGQTSEVGSSVKADGGLHISADKDINSRAAELSAQGALSLAAQGNIILDAGQTQTHFDEAMTRSSSDLLSTTTTHTQTQTQSSSASAQVNTLQGKTVSVVAEKKLVSVGTTFKGADSVYVEGKDTTALYAATNTAQSSTTTQSSSSFLGISLENKTTTDSKLQNTSIGTRLVSTQKVEIGVGNKAELQGTDIEAAQIAFTKTDPNRAGELILGGSTNTTQTSHTEKNETLGLYQEAKGQGSTVQTLNQTTLKGNVTFDAGLKITAQIPKDMQATAGGQVLAAQVQTLQQTLGANSAGLAYLNQLASNPNVQWDKVALANEHWSYDQAGLTPAGAALLSIAVAAYTGGMGAELLGGTSATAATATTAATSATLAGSTMLGAAANAGFASLASQTAVAMVNNGGDIGKTLQQLGSEQSIKGLLTTMVTAGALDKLGNSTLFNGQSGAASAGPNSISTAQTAATFGDKLLKNVTNNVAGAAIDSAINGKSFDEKSLSTALTSALITTGMASVANGIGDAKLNTFTSSLAHAALGCVGGTAIAGNGSGCSAGAIGGVIGELAANYALNSGMSDTQAVALAKVLSATAGVLVGGGGDNVAAVNIASTAGANAAESNRILHKTETQKAAQLAKQSSGKFTQTQIEDAMRNSGNTQFNEDINSNTQISNTDTRKPMDAGAQFQLGSEGKTLVQVQPNGGKVDPALAAYIIANTGGANSPYAWLDVQIGRVTPPSNPNAGLNIMTPNVNGCVTADCAGGVSQTKSDNRTQAQIDTSLNQTTTGIATAPLWVPVVGGAAIYSPLGFAVGAGGDAAGQAYQSYSTTGEVTIRPAQSVFSGVTGAFALPLAAILPPVGVSASGATALAGNAAVGGITGATNTLFNNLYYDEATRLDAAGGLGAVFGVIGSGLGSYTGKLLKDLMPNSVNIPITGPVTPFAAQGSLNPVPTKIGNTVSNTIGAVPAFIPLDNGKGPTTNNKSDEIKK